MNGVCYRLTGRDFQSVMNGKYLDADFLQEVGLYDTLSDCRHQLKFTCQNTSSGIVIYPYPKGWDPKNDRFVLSSDIEWFRWGSYEIGFDPNHLPSPESLARQDLHADWKIIDSTGQEWMIPAINSPIPNRTRLEQEAKFDPDTQTMSFGVSDANTELWEDVGRFMDQIRKTEAESAEEDESDADPEITDEWLLNLAVRILQQNYRLNAGVLAVLSEAGVKVLVPQSVTLICGMAADAPLFAQFQKKSGIGELPELSPGVEVELPSTDQPGDSLKSQPTTTEA